MQAFNNNKNPFAGYLLKLQKEKKKVNPVHEIVNTYHIWKGTDGRPKEFYGGKYGYGKLASEAKRLLTACGNSLDDALWSLDRMKYKAEKGRFNWSIITCLKHKLQ